MSIILNIVVHFAVFGIPCSRIEVVSERVSDRRRFSCFSLLPSPPCQPSDYLPAQGSPDTSYRLTSPSNSIPHLHVFKTFLVQSHNSPSHHYSTNIFADATLSPVLNCLLFSPR